MAEISVIICTHNPRADFLTRVLEALQQQYLSRDHWELLLIDNASETILADHWDLSWHPLSRHVREETPGLTPARLRGIKESRGGLLVFVDDDNVLAPDFLKQALKLSAVHPHLGVLGAGALEPEFEVPPPAELLTRLNMFAIRTVPAAVWSNNPKDYSCMPMGAGLCVTRRIAAEYQQLLDRLDVSQVVDRRGAKLFSGGDDLFSWASVGAGLGFGIFPELRVKHLMLAKRLNHAYFLRLSRDHSFSHGVLRYLLTGAKPRKIDHFQYVRLFLHRLRNGKFSVQCQWAQLQGEDNACKFIADHQLRPLTSCA
jgi:glycosyltransferase involved in cell wall biosynthesis